MHLFSKKTTTQVQLFAVYAPFFHFLLFMLSKIVPCNVQKLLKEVKLIFRKMKIVTFCSNRILRSSKTNAFELHGYSLLVTVQVQFLLNVI